MSIRDEAKLVTVCGCTKIISIPPGAPFVQVSYSTGRRNISARFLAETDFSYGAEQTYNIRRFADAYETDGLGYRLFREVPDRIDTPAQYDELSRQYDDLAREARRLNERYWSLWDSVYKVDEGL